MVLALPSLLRRNHVSLVLCILAFHDNVLVSICLLTSPLSSHFFFSLSLALLTHFPPLSSACLAHFLPLHQSVPVLVVPFHKPVVLASQGEMWAVVLVLTRLCCSFAQLPRKPLFITDLRFNFLKFY